MDLKDVLMALALFGSGGAIGSWLNELRRNRREDRVRWHGERREAYERFLTAAETMYNSELVIAQHIGNLRESTDWGDDPLFDEEYLLRQAEMLNDEWTSYAVGKVRSERPLANTARDQLASSLAAIEMISDPMVVSAARGYHATLHTFVLTAAEYPPRECGGWSEPLADVSDRVQAGRETFVAATRKELGVE
jgi:hypothetical protein